MIIQHLATIGSSTLFFDPLVHPLLELGCRFHHINRQILSVKGIRRVVEQVLRNGRSVNDCRTRWQQHWILHKGAHEWIEEFVGRIRQERIVTRHSVSSCGHERGERFKVLHRLARQEIELSARFDRLFHQLGTVVATLGTLHLKLGCRGKESKDGAEVAEHFLGAKVVLFRILDLKRAHKGMNQYAVTNTTISQTTVNGVFNVP